VPAGTIGGGLQTISCPTANACQAVGLAEFSGSVFAPIVDGWNGSAWAVETIPNPDNSNLSGVDCSAAKTCTAVGDVASGGDLLTLALRWNGTTWTVQSTPNPPGGVRNFLISVSCASATSCMSVGFDTDSSGNSATLAESWNGSTWKVLTTPNPTGSTTAQLNTVSCTSATACMATGSDNGSTFAEQWNGTKWTMLTTPTPSGGRDAFLGGVSCTAASACTAVGSYVTSADKQVPLAERWNGTSWTPQTAAVPSGSSSELASVSCTTTVHTMACTAVGMHIVNHVESPLAEQWNGTNWQVKTTQIPSGSQQTVLTGVSCSSDIACVSIGFWTDSTGFQGPVGELYS
jgi:hypothetical protein